MKMLQIACKRLKWDVELTFWTKIDIGQIVFCEMLNYSLNR